MGGGQEAYASLAQDSATGYGGAVGLATDSKGLSEEEAAQRKEANAKMMETIMSGGGNVREMAMALQNFQTMMAKDLMDQTKGEDGLTKRERLTKEMERRKAEEDAKKSPTGDEAINGSKPADQVASDAEKTAASFSAGELANVMARFDATGAAKAENEHGGAKAMFSPTKAEKAADGRHAEFGAAKSEDTTPRCRRCPATSVEATRRLQAAQDSVDRATTRITTLTGQKTVAQQQLTQAEAAATSVEGRAAGATDAEKAGLTQQANAARAAVTAKRAELARPRRRAQQGQGRSRDGAGAIHRRQDRGVEAARAGRKIDQGRREEPDGLQHREGRGQDRDRARRDGAEGRHLRDRPQALRARGGRHGAVQEPDDGADDRGHQGQHHRLERALHQGGQRAGHAAQVRHLRHDVPLHGDGRAHGPEAREREARHGRPPGADRRAQRARDQHRVDGFRSQGRGQGRQGGQGGRRIRRRTRWPTIRRTPTPTADPTRRRR
jgi:hypothetical protein